MVSLLSQVFYWHLFFAETLARIEQICGTISGLIARKTFRHPIVLCRLFLGGISVAVSFCGIVSCHSFVLTDLFHLCLCCWSALTSVFTGVFVFIRLFRLIFPPVSLVSVCFDLYITKTSLYNSDPLNPTFYNWGLKGYTLFFLFLLKT